ncbi:MAG TPA: S8/S53 family peptidase, partial [Rhodothermales bacterium]|nr:S8/S53 family peptidase [Rhodothermales bacterium]
GTYRALTRQGTWETRSIAADRRERDGGPDGFDSISGASLAKNVLTVGSARFNLDQVAVSSFSSFGPTDDGRIKPDLVGSGEQVFSTLSSGITAYGYSSGTSMASPNVAGSVALLQEHYQNLTGQYMRAATLKGLALHSARDAGPAGPDYQYGWGVLDTEAAARQITESLANGLALQEAVLSNGATFTQHATVSEAGPLRVSISWTDLASSRLPIRGTSTLNDRTPHLQNDLDLRVINDKTGETYLPFTLNPEQPSAAAVPGDNVVDPFEQVLVATVPAGSYTIVVTHKGTLVAEDPQPFSLIVTGAEGAVRPVAVGHFEADPSLEEVVLTWQTPFERSEGTFVVRRAPLTVYPDGRREAGTFVEVGTQTALGVSEQEQTYTFTDPRVASGRHLYRIFFENDSGPYLAAELEALVPAPEQYDLLSNYPNPFNDHTTIVLDLPEQQTLTVEVYDILGRRLAQVYSGTLPAGRHEMPVDANGWAPGVYFARFITPEAVRSHRMVVTR